MPSFITLHYGLYLSDAVESSDHRHSFMSTAYEKKLSLPAIQFSKCTLNTKFYSIIAYLLLPFQLQAVFRQLLLVSRNIT